MNAAARDAAAAVHSILPADPVFPAKGVIVALGGVNRVGAVPVVVGLVVTVGGVRYVAPQGLSWSGAFLAEADIADPTVLVGRDVKVESIGGRPVVAYTINGGS